MAQSFFPARGCVYQVQTSGGGARDGFYSIDELKASKSIILLQGVEEEFSDIIQPVVTLEDTKLIYTFGSDFGNVSVYGEILVGPAGEATNGAEDVIKFFQDNRISVTKKTISISKPGGKAVAAYLFRLVVGRIDPEFHILPFVLTGLVAET